jgi:hypothetical protein
MKYCKSKHQVLRKLCSSFCLEKHHLLTFLHYLLKVLLSPSYLQKTRLSMISLDQVMNVAKQTFC